MNNTSPDFFPRINYVSIIDVTLDSPNLSMEANALAMKYLSDEELARLSVGFQRSHGMPSGMTPRKDVNPLLRTALVGNLCHASADKSMVGVSSVGFRAAVDMSMASRKYMEKYGLLEIGVAGGGKDEIEEETSQRKKIKKKTKKKKAAKKMKNLAVVSSQPDNSPHAASHPSNSPRMDGENDGKTPNRTEGVSPGSDRQSTNKSDRIRATPTLNVNSQKSSPASDTPADRAGAFEPWLGKRPAKKLIDTGTFQMFGGDRGQEDQVRGQGGSKVKGQSNLKPVGNILDISRLQELPKLL